MNETKNIIFKDHLERINKISHDLQKLCYDVSEQNSYTNYTEDVLDDFAEAQNILFKLKNDIKEQYDLFLDED